MDDILQHKHLIEYDEVIHSLKKNHVIFIEGIGLDVKTTFVHKITRDWATTLAKNELLVSLTVLNS